MNNLKKTAEDVVKHSSRITRNLEQLVEASALSLVSGFALYQAYQNPLLNRYFAKVLFIAGLLIAVRAAALFIKHLDRE